MPASQQVKTMKVKADTKSGFMIINADRYDPEIHTPFDGKTSPSNEEAFGSEAVEIPADWQGLHWSKRNAIALKIDPDFERDPDDVNGSINAVIEDYLEG